MEEETAEPDLSDPNNVVTVLAEAAARNYDEVVIMGLKERRAYLHYSKFDSTYRIVGALTDISNQLLNNR